MFTLFPINLYFALSVAVAGHWNGWWHLGFSKSNRRSSSAGVKYRNLRGCSIRTALVSPAFWAARNSSKTIVVCGDDSVICRHPNPQSYVKFFVHLDNRTSSLYQPSIAWECVEISWMPIKHLLLVKQHVRLADGSTMSNSLPHFSSTLSDIRCCCSSYRSSR